MTNGGGVKHVRMEVVNMCNRAGVLYSNTAVLLPWSVQHKFFFNQFHLTGKSKTRPRKNKYNLIETKPLSIKQFC